MYHSVANIYPEMSRHSKNTRLLEKIINTDEECWNIDERKLSETENKVTYLIHPFLGIVTDNEEENILNKCGGQKRRRLVLSDVEDLQLIPS